MYHMRVCIQILQALGKHLLYISGMILFVSPSSVPGPAWTHTALRSRHWQWVLCYPAKSPLLTILSNLDTITRKTSKLDPIQKLSNPSYVNPIKLLTLPLATIIS